VQHTVCYEQPLNERVRMLLRLEFLFLQITHAAAGRTPWDSRFAVQILFDIINLAHRNELKTEILKELERHSTSLSRLRQTPGVDAAALDGILQELDRSLDGMRKLDSTALEEIRQNEFLNAIRQRSNVPGGTCRFDMPALHHWLLRDESARSRQIHAWLDPFLPIQQSVGLLLKLIRASANPRPETAAQGFFQKSLDNAAPNQLVRVQLPADTDFFPEISAGRHRFSIRFMEQPNPNRRPTPTDKDVAFQLLCCVI